MFYGGETPAVVKRKNRGCKNNFKYFFHPRNICNSLQIKKLHTLEHLFTTSYNISLDVKAGNLVQMKLVKVVYFGSSYNLRNFDGSSVKELLSQVKL